MHEQRRCRQVVTHEHQLRTYESDGLLQYAVTPSAVVAAGHRRGSAGGSCAPATGAGVPGWPAAAGSGLSGGAMPVDDGIVISLSRMRKILEVDLPNQRVVVRARRDQHRGLAARSRPITTTRPDPSRQMVCTIGGNVAENSGGAHCFKYGFTINYVTGLESSCLTASWCASAGKQSTSPDPTCWAHSSARRERLGSLRR